MNDHPNYAYERVCIAPSMANVFVEFAIHGPMNFHQLCEAFAKVGVTDTTRIKKMVEIGKALDLIREESNGVMNTGA